MFMFVSLNPLKVVDTEGVTWVYLPPLLWNPWSLGTWFPWYRV